MATRGRGGSDAGPGVRRRAVAMAVAATVAAAGCGRAAAPARPAGTRTATGGGVPVHSGGASAAFPDAQALGSLTNYAFRYQAAGVTITGEVHSPSDWQTDQPIVERHIGGALYTEVGGSWVSVPDAAGTYAASPYPSSVRTLVAFLQVPGAKAAEGSACSVAGVAGHGYTITAPGSAIGGPAAACVADRGGALLSASVGAAGPVAWSLLMTAVGTVATLPAPSAVAAGSPGGG